MLIKEFNKLSWVFFGYIFELFASFMKVNCYYLVRWKNLWCAYENWSDGQGYWCCWCKFVFFVAKYLIVPHKANDCLKLNSLLQILEGRSYRLQHPWVGVVNRSQQDINKNVDMIAARRRERDYFSSTPEYKHLAPRMGSEYLAKMLSKVYLSSLL